MNRFVPICLGLLALALLPRSSAAETAPLGVTEVDPPTVVDDCWECHACPGWAEMRQVSQSGVSTQRRETYLPSCIEADYCGGCDEETQDEDAELALTVLIESEGENVLRWMEEYRGDFALTVVGNTLQVSRTCGQSITWLALGESDLASATELLE